MGQKDKTPIGNEKIRILIDCNRNKKNLQCRMLTERKEMVIAV